MNKICLFIYVVLVASFIGATWGLSVVETTYQKYTVHIDSSNNFEAVVFTISFDEVIGFIPVNSSNANVESQAWIAGAPQNKTVDVCFPPLACAPATLFAANLYGLIGLTCPSEYVPSVPSYNGDYDGISPPSYLTLFYGTTKEPLLNFFTQLGYLDARAGYGTPANSQKLYALLITSYTEKGVPFLFGFGKFRTITEDLARGTCSITFRPKSLNYYLTSHSSGQPFINQTTPMIKQATPVTCSYFNSLAISNSIYTTIKNMSNAPTWDALQQLQFQNALLESSDTVSACEDFISTYMTYQPATVTFPNTTECLRSSSDPLYATDPCCNTTLQFYYCCAASSKNVTTQTLKSLQTGLKCKNKDQSGSLLNDYIVNTNAAEDLLTGCRATASKVANDAILDKYTSFIDKCLGMFYGSDVYGDTPVPCTSDDDCLTHCTAFNFCYIDHENAAEILLDCQLALIDPFVVTLLRAEWQLPNNVTGDKFRQEYYNRMSSENCVGFWAPYYTWVKDSKNDLHWVSNQKEDCLADMYCTYDSSLSEDECTKRGKTCTYNIVGIAAPIGFPVFCYATAKSEEDCIALGGDWDMDLQPWECRLSAITSREECIPDDLCPPSNSTDYVEAQCTSTFCYDPTIAEEDCVSQCNASVLYKWNSKVVNGSGYCQIMTIGYDACVGAGGTWWDGRGWIKGHYNTQEECDAGSCLVGTKIFVNGDCGTYEECTQPCKVCDSTTGATLCYSTNMSSCDCTLAGGTYDIANDICTFGFGKETCAKEQLNWLSCPSLSKSQCNACSSGDPSCPKYADLLHCEFAWMGTCEDKAMCLSSGGQCSDLFFNPNPNCSAVSAFPAPDCTGSCLHALMPYPSGKWGCYDEAWEVTTPLGCLDVTIYTKAECESYDGYWWQESYISEQECEANKGCQLGATVNLQNQAECSECNGNYQPLYTWSPGEWVTGRNFPLDYIEANWTQLNKWQRTLDFAIIENTINRVVAEKFANAIQTESMCLYNPLLEVINHIACDCTGDSSAPPDCYSDGTRITSVGVQRFYAGIGDSIKAGSVKITVYENSIPIATAYLDVDIDIASASQFRKSQTLSINALSSSLDSNPYAIIKNTHKAVVGQLVGDGVILAFMPSKFRRDPSSPQGDASFELEHPMQVCIQMRSDISRSTHDFPVPDFAITTDFKSWTPVEATVNVTSDGYCFELNRQGTYFPILRTTDWATRHNKPFIDNKAVLAFIYIFGVVFLVLSFVSAYQMWVGAHHITRHQKLNLAVILFFFMFLFNMVRGLYLLILPSERLEHNEGAKYFLSEAPQFFFFTVYSVIIFLWAELSTMVITKKKSVMNNFRWPFAITNISLYILFIVVVATYHNLTPKRQLQLKKAYVYILACCCICAVIAFNVFGKKLISIQLRARHTKSAKTASVLNRMILTLVVSSFTILAQIIFLFVVTYDTVSQGVALMSYVLTEVLPSITLLYTLRPLSRKFVKGPSVSSTENVKSGSEIKSSVELQKSTSAADLQKSSSTFSLQSSTSQSSLVP